MAPATVVTVQQQQRDGGGGESVSFVRGIKLRRELIICGAMASESKRARATKPRGAATVRGTRGPIRVREGKAPLTRAEAQHVLTRLDSTSRDGARVLARSIGLAVESKTAKELRAALRSRLDVIIGTPAASHGASQATEEEDEEEEAEDEQAPQDEAEAPEEEERSTPQQAKRIRQSERQGSPAAPPASGTSASGTPPAKLLTLPQALWPGMVAYLDERGGRNATTVAKTAVAAVGRARHTLAAQCLKGTECGGRCFDLFGDAKAYAGMEGGCQKACLDAVSPRLLRGLRLWTDAAADIEVAGPEAERWSSYRPLFAPRSTAEIVYTPPPPYGSGARRSAADLGPRAGLEWVGGIGYGRRLDEAFVLHVDLGPLNASRYEVMGAMSVHLDDGVSVAISSDSPAFRKLVTDTLVNPTMRRVLLDVVRVAGPRRFHLYVRTENRPDAFIRFEEHYEEDNGRILSLLKVVSEWLPQDLVAHWLHLQAQLGGTPFKAVDKRDRKRGVRWFQVRDVGMPGCPGHEDLVKAATRGRAEFVTSPWYDDWADNEVDVSRPVLREVSAPPEPGQAAAVA